jgi:hypothetical protein
MKFATGYCTNVHAGANLAQTMDNLQTHATAVRQQFSPNGLMGIGLWLSASTAEAMVAAPDGISEFAEFLHTNQLVPYTMNGFPFGDFHQAKVKHDVYLPTWLEPPRADYTRTLVQLLDAILPAGADGSISTVPIAWGTPSLTAEQSKQAAQQLYGVAQTLRQLEDESGRFISLCIEPEPGCAIGTSVELVRFFEDYLVGAGDEALVRRYLRVCHDVCHANVMFEPQAEVLDLYASHGIEIGKVQVSAAVVANFEQTDDRAGMLEQLAAFGEDRYLHQTCVRANGTTRFFEDLPEAIAEAREDGPVGEWRVHFHVPVYLRKFGLLETSQDDVIECLTRLPPDTHYEVETYAWNVLPAELQCETLAEGIAKELKWFASIVDSPS